MEKFITDERTGLRYELVGDYYLIAGEDKPEGRSNVFSSGKTAFRKRGRNGSPQSGKSNAVSTENEQHPQRCYGNRFE